MNDEELRRRLAAVSLSEPGVTLDEVMARAAAAPRRRAPSLGRMALATVLVWFAVWVVQAVQDRSLGALALPRSTLVAAESRAPDVARRTRLLRELMAEGPWSEAEASPVPDLRPNPPSPGRAGRGKSSQLPMRRWSHV